MMLKRELWEFLSDLTNIETYGQRKALLFATNSNENKLRKQIKFESSNLTFCAELIDLLTTEGKDSLLYFLNNLDKSEWVGLDRKEKLKSLREEIQKLDVVEFNEKFSTPLWDIDTNQLQQDWLKWEENTRGIIYALELNHHNHINVIKSPLEELWKEFLQTPKWHEVLRNRLKIIQLESEAFSELSPLIEQINKINLTNNYESILTGDLCRLFPNNIDIVDSIIERNQKKIDKIKKEIDDRKQKIKDSSKFRDTRSNKVKRDKKKEIEKLRELAQILTDEDRKRIRKIENVRDSAITIKQELYEIQEIVEFPLFSKCFLVEGEIGSGKTHFILSLLGNRYQNIDDSKDTNNNKYNEQYDDEEDEAEKFLFLFLEPNKDKSIEEIILNESLPQINIPFDNLKQFNLKKINSFLEIEKLKLIIIIDELNEWSNLRPKFHEELIRFIVKNTDLHSIFWLITLQNPNFDPIFYNQEFWKRYSFIDNPLPIASEQHKNLDKSFEDFIPNLVGWIDLDELNVKNQVGLELIQKALEHQEDSNNSLVWLYENWDWITKFSYSTNNYSEKNVKSEQNFCFFYWSNPFIAWILLDLIKRGTPIEKIVDLNFIEFITHFWEQRLSKLNISPLDSYVSNDAEGREIIDNFTRFVAQFIATSGEVNPLERDLLEYLNKIARDCPDLLPSKEIIPLSIKLLINGSLLKKQKAEVPKLKSRPSKQLIICFPPFWEWRLAQELIKSNSIEEQNINDAREELEIWFEFVELQSIKEGVFEFFLLLLDRSEFLTSEFITNLWLSGLESQSLPSASTWLSGSRASQHIQLELANLAKTFSSNSFSSKENIKQHEIFAFIYFIIQALSNVFHPSIRLKILQTHYQNIKDYSLSEYYLYSIQKLFTRIEDNKIILECMPFFSGCEIMEITPALAWITVSTMSKNVDDDMEIMLRDVLTYLEHAETEDRPNNHKKEQCYFYWEWFIRYFCRHIVEIKRQDAFSFLNNNHWYYSEQLNIDKNTNMGFVMQREATLALGYGYRAEWSDQEQLNFIKTIEYLINSKSFTARKTAFYLMRHTKSTGGQKGVKLDKKFQPFLRKIFLDPRMKRIKKTYRKLFEQNLDNETLYHGKHK